MQQPQLCTLSHRLQTSCDRVRFAKSRQSLDAALHAKLQYLRLSGEGKPTAHVMRAGEILHGPAVCPKDPPNRAVGHLELSDQTPHPQLSLSTVLRTNPVISWVNQRLRQQAPQSHQMASNLTPLCCHRGPFNLSFWPAQHLRQPQPRPSQPSGAIKACDPTLRALLASCIMTHKAGAAFETPMTNSIIAI